MSVGPGSGPPHVGPGSNLRPASVGAGVSPPVAVGPATVTLRGGGDGGVDMYASQTFLNLAEWSFAHNLGKKPGVEVLDQFGDVISGPDVIVDETTVTARWPGPMSGTIVCS